MNVFVYVEAKENKPLPGSLELLTPAAALGCARAVVVGDAAAAQQAAAYGVPVTLLETQDTCPDAVASVLEQYIAAQKPELVLMSATQLGKDLAPRLAQRFNAGCATDVTLLENADSGLVMTRPAFGGTVLERLRLCAEKTQFATVRSGCYTKPKAGAPAEVSTVKAAAAAGSVKAKVLEAVREITEAVDLEGADVIVTGGRGMGDAEHFKLVERLAELLGGVVGASRPAIEEGWISRAHQVGQSGKIVAPKLYIACGISGAMQHISGVMGAQYIVAVNKDEAASIFDIADLGIVGDVKEVLPLLIEEIERRQNA